MNEFVNCSALAIIVDETSDDQGRFVLNRAGPDIRLTGYPVSDIDYPAPVGYLIPLYWKRVGVVSLDINRKLLCIVTKTSFTANGIANFELKLTNLKCLATPSIT
jgi:hypothetical protein